MGQIAVSLGSVGDVTPKTVIFNLSINHNAVQNYCRITGTVSGDYSKSIDMNMSGYNQSRQDTVAMGDTTCYIRIYKEQTNFVGLQIWFLYNGKKSYITNNSHSSQSSFSFNATEYIIETSEGLLLSKCYQVQSA